MNFWTRYKNLGEFFSRPLKENSRKIMRDAKAVTSPVDGKVMSLGEVQWNNDKMPILEQIKVQSNFNISAE